MNIKKIFIIVCCLMLFLLPTAALAETTESGEPAPSATVNKSTGEVNAVLPEGSSQIKLSLPPTLYGYNVVIKDAAGATVVSTALDAKGEALITIPKIGSYVANVVTDKPKSIDDETKKVFSLNLLQTIEVVLLALIVSGLIVFLITRKHFLNRFKGVIEVTEDERIDD